MRVQRYKDMLSHIKAHNNPDLTYRFAISEITNRCPYLLPTRKSEKKHKKSHIFLLKSFADSEKSRTFAVHLRNKGAYLTHRNPYITMPRSLIYLHVSVIMERLLFAAVILFITDSANVR